MFVNYPFMPFILVQQHFCFVNSNERLFWLIFCTLCDSKSNGRIFFDVFSPLPLGTTTVECKSGYGLEAATEIKMLKVLEKAKTATPIEIASTFLGAHSIPK